MSVLQKLKDLKRVLDRNLATRSSDILPVLNECIIELEAEQTPVPVPTVKEKEIKNEQHKEVIEVKQEESIAEIEGTDTRDIEKEAKQFLKDNGITNRKFLKGDKAVNKAIELGFNI